MSDGVKIRYRGFLVPVAALGILLLAPVGIAGAEESPPKKDAADSKAAPPVEKPASAPGKDATPAKPEGKRPGEAIEVPPPPFSEGVFPCTDCHEKGKEVDTTRRELSEHDFKFEHDAEHRWCLDRHSAEDRDKLHLASGEKIEFTDSYKLCGQCHGEKLRDWLAGVHGRRTGMWDGKKKYLLCVNCHNPHSPRFRPLKPEPPPVRPERLGK